MSITDFQILEKLGEGAYSTVYKVKRYSDGQIYAFKKVKLEKLKDKEKENALNEVRILASIQHPHIIAYKEAFIDDATSCLCLITEFADNGDLFQKVQNLQKQNAYMHEGEIWKILIQLTFGLKKLHDLKIFHRDLKSANVFMFKDGTVKLGDMNVSKVAKQGLLFTQTGTPFYASPEVWRDQPYDSKSDIWSLGWTDMENLYNNVLTGKFQPIPSVFSHDIANVIKSMLSVNSKLRPTCLTVLNMESVKKRIEKYFSSDYLLQERQTYQGIKKKQQMEIQDPSLAEKDMLLNTIRLTENIFTLKDKLPTPQYNGNRSSKISRQLESNRKSSLGKEESIEKTETEKKIEAVMPLSYLSPNQVKKKDDNQQNIIKVRSQLSIVSIDAFDPEGKDQAQDQPTSNTQFQRKKSKKFQAGGKKPSQKSIQTSISTLDKQRIPQINQIDDYTPLDMRSFQRERKIATITSKKDKQPQQQDQVQVLKNSASQMLILPKIGNMPRSTIPSQEYGSIFEEPNAMNRSQKPTGKNGLLISVNNVLKNDSVPLSYLKIKQQVKKEQLQLKSNPSNNRYKGNQANLNQMSLPELRGLSLESYKYFQDFNASQQTAKNQLQLSPTSVEYNGYKSITNQDQPVVSEAKLRILLKEKRDKSVNQIRKSINDLNNDLTLLQDHQADDNSKSKTLLQHLSSPANLRPPSFFLQSEPKNNYSTTQNSSRLGLMLKKEEAKLRQGSEDTEKNKESLQERVKKLYQSYRSNSSKQNDNIEEDDFSQNNLNLLQGSTFNSTQGESNLGSLIKQNSQPKQIFENDREYSFQLGNEHKPLRVPTQGNAQNAMNSKKASTQREDSMNSDNVDRDEESHPASNLNMQKTQSTRLKSSISKALRSSIMQKSLPSYKLDGAKLLVNRLQVQLKKRFSDLCESIEALDDSCKENNPKELKDRWKFVRTVMSNIDTQQSKLTLRQLNEKRPLKDKTNNYTLSLTNLKPNAEQKESSFAQIQQMFENFKAMRASSNGEQLNKLKEQENIAPNTNSNIKKFVSKSKDGFKKLKTVTKRAADLPPQYSLKNTAYSIINKNKNQKGFGLNTVDQFLFNSTGSQLEAGDSFSSTFRENEYFITMNQHQNENMLQQQMLTSRSNLVLDEGIPEGLQQLPLESPMNTEKFISRRQQYLKQDQQIMYLQQQQHHYLKRILILKQLIQLRLAFNLLRQKSQAFTTLKKLIKRRVQEDKLTEKVQQKTFFIRLIKNCIFKSKLEGFLHRVPQRLQEKAFDKLKENNWIIEERKETLELIIVRQKLKQTFRIFKENSNFSSKIQGLVNSLNFLKEFMLKKQEFNNWKNKASLIKSTDYRNQKLLKTLKRQFIVKQGFYQFKKMSFNAQQNHGRALRFSKVLGNLQQKRYFLTWQDQTQKQAFIIQKQQIIVDIMHSLQECQLKRSFCRWRQNSEQVTQDIQKEQRKAVLQIIYPLIRMKEIKLKQKALAKFKIKEQRKFQKIHVKLLTITINKQLMKLYQKGFNKWKYSVHQKIVKMSFIDESLIEQTLEDDYDAQDKSKVDALLIPTTDNIHLTFGTKSPSDNESQSEDRHQDSENDNEDFENLNQIRRISYESSSLKKIMKYQNIVDEEDSSPLDNIAPLQLNKRGISEVVFTNTGNGGSGSNMHNLRYQ